MMPVGPGTIKGLTELNRPAVKRNAAQPTYGQPGIPLGLSSKSRQKV